MQNFEELREQLLCSEVKMSSDWDEIRRLAADLQRAQLSGAVQKLSEMNCVEIVSRLCDLGLVEVSS